MRRWSLGGIVLGVAYVLSACGGAAGEGVRPKDFTGKDALGGGAASCTGKPSAAQPFVVDLDSSARTALEAQMKRKGAVVVAYDCQSLRVLARCTAPGSGYEYAGVQRKEDVVQLKNQGELTANLPFSSGKLGAEISNGRTLDIATVSVGQRSVVASKFDRAELEGECEGATHYVATATVGAFSMATGSVGKVVAAAELFKIGASGKSEASKNVAKSDGLFDSCKTSDPDADKPPAECRAPLRVELQPLKGGPVVASNDEDAEGKNPKDKPGKKKDKDDKKGSVASAVENPCPDGFVFTGRVCAVAEAEVAHVCNPKDRAECKAQCEKGSAESCYNFARRMPKSTSSGEQAAAYKKACELGHADGCGAQAFYSWPSLIDTKTDKEYDELYTAKYEPQWRESLAAAKLGCAMGSAESCETLGDTLDMSVEFPNFKDEAASHRAYERSCKLGNAMACGTAAGNLRQGYGVKKDFAKALALLERSCDGGLVDNCIDLADVLHEGYDGSPKDEARAFEIASRYCKPTTSWSGCMIAAESAKAIKKDDKVVFELYKSECEHGSWNGCEALAELYATGKGTPKDVNKAKEIWKKGCEEYEDADSCKKLGKAPAPAAKAATPKKSAATKPAPKKK